MDQLKEILKQAIKYRFWIAVGVSALLPMIAYFVGVGAVQAEATKQTAAITSAEKDVKQYASGNVVNDQYKPVVTEKTAELTSDVNASWKKLYNRQAPLLTWPERVQDRFTTWGRKWPENVDPSTIHVAIIDYINAYPGFVTQVYKSFKPFDPVDGSGVVSAHPEAALLRPATFKIESPPSLGKVWASQERLWIQRTLLDVVAQVNKDAKNWDAAVIKQINELEVGSPVAQDQRSIAKGETLEDAPDVKDPSKPEEPAEDASAGGGMPGAEGMASMMGGMAGMRGGMMGGMMGGAAAPETVSYIKQATDNGQFKVMPVEMSVLIEQDHIQDLLVALENSPMTIQVMDFEMQKPTTRVTKPEKGSQMAFGNMMGGMGMMGGDMMAGMMGSMMGRRGVGGYGGNMARQGMMGPGMAGMGGYGGMMGMGMGMGMGQAESRKGVDARSKNRGKEAEERAKEARKGVASTLHDAYYNIVEVKVYGQARFFNPPPAAETPAPSQAEGDTEKQAETPRADAEKKAEPEKKAEAADAEKKDAAPKADAEKAEPEKKDAAPKADAEKKTEAPRTDAGKKDAAPKADAEKKADAPKSDAAPKK